ncbi:MAG TPA: response regulator [Geminicoccus sp.]|jgi:CheY-like chemotaxis protein|uniref:response regulator n=1 Tax=Geminicoccus sp. TaxID=2024832 RepID=UPI002E3445EA|nr:response regulator [Geminicoccus sp.]HEX2526666.1 response regulator [Geminicoccus sp.]
MVVLNRVMYVDDEEDLRSIVEMSLQMVGGMEVHLCTSGQEALARLPEIRPDLVLLDVMMPNMDGLQTLEAIRATPDFANLPVVFMTAKIRPTEVARLRDLGAADVIAKPFDVMQLPDQVREIWSRLQT